MFDFDLQMFAEEEEVQGTAEGTTESVSETAAPEETTEVAEPIPAELEGLSEDVARETMAEAKAAQEETPIEDSNSSKGAIPYTRFKEKVDETNALKQELEAYRQKYGELSQGAEQPTQQAAPPQQTQQSYTMQPVNIPQYQPQMPQFTPEIMGEIAKAAKAEALKMTGLTQEDADSLPYMEDDDPRKTQYNTALKMAEMNIFGRIQQAQQAEAMRRQEFLQQHNASVADYNAFAQKEMAEPDFQNIVGFATGEFFNGVPPVEQQLIASAYARVERNTASPQDIMLVKQYYTQAKAAFRGKGANKKTTNKAQVAQSFPRSQQVSGSGDANSMSPESIRKMLENTPWNEIPKNLQDKFRGM